MTEQQKKVELAAKQYVDKQLDTMKKYGSEPKNISDHEYRSLVQQVAQNISLK